MVLAPLPDEWSAPLRAGPLQLQAGVPTMLRLATAPWVGPLLNGRRLATRAGPVQLAWQAPTRTLLLHCAPCTLTPSALGEERVVLQELRLSIRRQGQLLDGELASGALRATWRGELSNRQLQVQLQLPSSAIADAYALFGTAIPELARARIEGRFALKAQFSLPNGQLSLTPQVEGFQVSGLGTEVFAAARSSCSRRTSRLAADSWLSRAVITAEDQRFYEHPGYDLAEFSASMRQNQRDGRISRGASTLPQQLAKLLVTGGERSPVRKLRELLYAVEMEQTLGKPRMLQLYLAHAPWGPGLCGAEAAAQHYFGQRAHALEPAQAVWLAAMLHNPGLEARRWAETGEINTARAQWVLAGLRGLPRRQRARLAEELAQPAWTPPRVPADPDQGHSPRPEAQ
ncbi:biosynthetic peptidoglycan transglycosylase [Polaromonas sp.]|uniref:biosynthetic peptidoglycan transglycosylase n=1 Tax=Polaromonas sp. TaxID=1869339 RepID=UPI003267ACB9